MVTRDDLESYLNRMDAEFDEVDDGMYLIRQENGGAPIVVHHSDPVVLVRIKVMDLARAGENRKELYEALLEMNATDVIHGAYGIEEGDLILSDTLQLNTLDYEELLASLESVQLAASTHYPRIRELAGLGGDA